MVFSRPVEADQSDDLARIDREVELVDRDLVSKTFGEVTATKDFPTPAGHGSFASVLGGSRIANASSRSCFSER